MNNTLSGGKFEGAIKVHLENNYQASEIIIPIVKGLTIVLLGQSLSHGIYSILLVYLVFEICHETNSQFSALNANRFWKGRTDEATVSSAFSLFARIGGALSNLIMGYIADQIGRQSNWILSGYTMIIMAIVIPIGVKY
jgi:fucose permease